MRNLCCDIAPHLALDNPQGPTLDTWYPWWGERFDFVRPNPVPYPAWQPYAGVYDDIFKSNPWFDNPNLDAQDSDNKHLYYDDAVGQETWSLSGHINPPLTLPPYTLVSWSKTLLFLNTRHPFLVYEYGSTPTLYALGQYGFDPNPDAVPFYPNSDWHGMRINCELVNPDDPYWWNTGAYHNNLQSFLVVEGGAGGGLVESYFGENAKPTRNVGIDGPARDKVLTSIREHELRLKNNK